MTQGHFFRYCVVLGVLCVFARVADAGEMNSPVLPVLKTVVKAGGDEVVPSLSDLAENQSLKEDLEKLRVENKRLLAENQELQREFIARDAPLQQKTKSLPARRGDFLKDLLTVSHIVPHEAIEAENGKLWNLRDYRWGSDDGIYGAAQELPWASGRGFKAEVEGYIRQQAPRCKAGLAWKIGDIAKEASHEVLEAEMTCPEETDSVSAALLFVADRDRISVITQEGTADQMPTAMSKRDLIRSAIPEAK